MRYSNIFTAIILVTLFLLITCSPEKAPMSSTVGQGPIKEGESDKAITKGDWEEKWERTLMAAKKEGKVVIYTTFAPEMRNAFFTGVKDKYGLSVEFVAGRGNELSQKLLLEKREGLHLADIYLGGATTIISRLKSRDLLAPLEPALILPEIRDPKAWLEGQLPWVDMENKYILVFDARPGGGMALRNIEMVKPGDLTSFNELLLPHWKGKILMDDPTVPGKGNRWFGVALQSKYLDVAFMRNLAKQEPLILRDKRLQVEWVARGKYPVSIAASTDLILEFKRAGSPLSQQILKEEIQYITSGSGNVTMIKEAVHPNAATIFINWLLSREGQTYISRISLTQSSRVDVTTEHLSEEDRRDPNIKYYMALKEEFFLKEAEMQKLAQEIFGPLIK